MLTGFSSVSASSAVIAPRCVVNRKAYLALLSVAVGAILVPPVLAQTFVSQGPSPISGAAGIVQVPSHYRSNRPERTNMERWQAVAAPARRPVRGKANARWHEARIERQFTR